MVVQNTSTCLVGLTLMGMGLLLFCLGLLRLIGPAHPAKPMALAFLFLSVGFGAVGLSLYVAGKSWHLPNASKPLVFTLAVGAIGIAFMLIGLLLMALPGKTPSGKQPTAIAEGQPPEGIWPPPPQA